MKLTVTLELDNLPAGTTEDNVHAALREGLSNTLDRAVGDEPLTEALHRAIPSSGLTATQRELNDMLRLADFIGQLNSVDLMYLRRVAHDPPPHAEDNNWEDTAPLREKLEGLGFVQSARHHGDSYCILTLRGQKALEALTP